MNTERMDSTEIRDWISFVMRQNGYGSWFAAGEEDSDKWIEWSRKNIPFSDVKTARDILSWFSDKIHYLPGLNTWYVWNGVYHEEIAGDLLAHWIVDAFTRAHRDALAVVEEHYVALAGVLSGDARVAKMKEFEKVKFAKHRAYLDKVYSRNGYTGLMNQIKTEFSVTEDYFVNDLQWLVFENGVLDLDALKADPVAPGDLVGLAARLLPHDPSRRVWRCINADLDPYAESSAWVAFLGTSLPDGELRKFLATVCGAAFMGVSKLKTIPVLKGRKDSGKTIFIDTIHKLAGGYGGQPDTSAINKMSGGQNFEQDAFRGLRFAAVSEPDTDRKVDDPFLKKFTGGDILSTRNLHARAVQWKSQGCLFFATNRDLKFNTSDKAILERFATVDFPHQFFDRTELPEDLGPDYLKDWDLEKKLESQLSGILNWVMNGALTYLAEGGVYAPESVRLHRVQQYVEGSSVIQWIEEIQAGQSASVEWNVEAAPGSCMRVGDLYQDYVMWCAEENEEARGRKTFSAEVQEHLGVQAIRNNRFRIPTLVSKLAVDF